jgi:hypothetical protein
MAIHGMVDEKVKNVTLENIDVEYRGGYTLRDVVEQKFMSATGVPYAEYMVPPGASGTYSYSVGGDFPRMRQESPGNWVEDPYNVKEGLATTAYPEPTNYGLLPAYGLYARHVDGLTVSNFKTTYLTEEGRPAIVLDDVGRGAFSGVNVQSSGTDAVLVTHKKKRRTHFEFVPGEPYKETTTSVTGLSALRVENVTIDAPEPGTPRDSEYSNATVVFDDTAYPFAYQRSEFPRTVNRPSFKGERFKDWTVKAGETVEFEVETINPADAITPGVTYPVKVTAQNLPSGAVFDGSKFSWAVTDKNPAGTYKIKFTANDDSPEAPSWRTINLTVADVSNPSDGGLGCDAGWTLSALTAALIAVALYKKRA